MALLQTISSIHVSICLCFIPLHICARLGLQSGIQRTVETVHHFVSPSVFFESFVIPGNPVLFKGAATSMSIFNKWSDDYFKSLPESEHHSVFVEEGKKENRKDGDRTLSFSEFIDIYKHEDIYCVSPLPSFLAREFLIYQPLDCPSVINLIEDNVMWFSSGGSKSVWHNDAYENLNCLFRGTKEFIMANRSEGREKVHIDMEDGSYSSVDVEDVDVEKYPGFKSTTFFNVTVEAGDCLYIPWYWFHAVTSYGSNLAVNLWWRTYRTPPLCDVRTFQNLDQINFRAKDSEDGSHLYVWEAAHQYIYSHSDMYTGSTIGQSAFLESVGDAVDDYSMSYVSDDDIDNLFDELDSDQNSLLDYREIDTILTIFPKFLLSRYKDEL